MDDAAAAAPKPNGNWITAEATRLDVVLWPPPAQSSELIVRFAVTESHTWLPIGGAPPGWGRQLRPPRDIAGEASMPLSTSGADYLLRENGSHCRRLILDMAKQTLGKEYGDLFFHRDWEKVVPSGVEARVAELVAARRQGGCTCEVFVDVSVHVRFLYLEARALLRECVFLSARDRLWGTASGGGGAGDVLDGDGAAPSCSICFEEAAEATRLPGCGHGFHSECIGKWFQKASTCPVCRRDKFEYLSQSYRAVHDKMRSDHEGSY
ncbi:unnamed protein product [Urochloa decumbens]|uniref:RING-type E3 ubiquitin transferase n=1 Tax=Urochloa decumbens TaxID=240449 RepID=A0ABC9A5P3_9POAL